MKSVPSSASEVAPRIYILGVNHQRKNVQIITQEFWVRSVYKCEISLATILQKTHGHTWVQGGWKVGLERCYSARIFCYGKEGSNDQEMFSPVYLP